MTPMQTLAEVIRHKMMKYSHEPKVFGALKQVLDYAGKLIEQERKKKEGAE